ncbi:MAG: threonine aldolase, partial [Bacteroidales bacterium]|nr:threonine aldolase [Bacteroidales bacterium]
FKVEPRNVETNMVYFEIEYPDDICREIIKRLKNDGILVDYKGNGLFRMVTHKDIGGQDIEKALSVFRAAVSTK